jgi:hypothetical protein
VLFLRSAKSIDPQYYLADRGRELSHVDAAQRALLGSASTTYFSGSQVTEEGFVSFLNGQPLDAKRPLTSKHRSVHALELLAVAPKVASIAALLGNDAMAGAVVEGHHQALEGALRYLEHHGAWSNHADQQPLEGLSAVRFTHGVSRA